MALDKKITDLVKDLKLNDKPLVDALNEINDRAEAKDKIQAANDDLTAQRKEWSTEKKDFKSKITDLEAATANHDADIKKKDKKILLLEKDKFSPEDRKKLAASEDQEAMINKLTNDVSSLKENFEKKEAEATEEREKRKIAESEKRIQEQNTAISNELNSHKILDSKNEQALYTIKGKKLAKLATNEDGTIEEKYFVVNNGKIEPSTLKEMIADFAKNNEHLIAPSGNIGSGQQHDRNLNRETKPINDLYALKAQAAAELSGT